MCTIQHSYAKYHLVHLARDAFTQLLFSTLRLGKDQTKRLHFPLMLLHRHLNETLERHLVHSRQA